MAGSLAAQTPNDFFKKGTPTFITGTAGDERADRASKTQVVIIRDLLFLAAREPACANAGTNAGAMEAAFQTALGQR
jgi:hypothetical protein